MGMVQGSKDKKNLEVELNLLPVFDVLSVCICFLLMTVVWVEVRSLETKQAIGSQIEDTKSSSGSISVTIDDKNNLIIVTKNSQGKEIKRTAFHKNGSIDFDSAKKLFQSAAELKINTTHILPSRFTQYEQVIKLMDLAKQVGIINIGLSPI